MVLRYLDEKQVLWVQGSERAMVSADSSAGLDGHAYDLAREQ